MQAGLYYNADGGQWEPGSGVGSLGAGLEGNVTLLCCMKLHSGRKSVVFVGRDLN